MLPDPLHLQMTHLLFAASIAPVHSITAAIMDGVAVPHMLVDQSSSPHSTDLRPSQASLLQSADLVVWVGPNIETFLVEPLKALAGKARSLPLADVDGLVRLSVRTGGNWERHSHDHHDADEHDHDHEAADHDHDKDADEHDHDHEVADHDHDKDAHEHEHDEAAMNAMDNHIWMDPQNGIVMAKAIAHALVEVDPAHKDAYESNANALIHRLEDLIAKTGDELKPVQSKPFIVFHDAFQYFEHRFGLNAIGSIMLQPGVMPGAARIKEIREKLKATKAVCLMSEPQFSSRILPTLLEGTSAQLGELDPIGKALKAGPDLYPELIAYNAKALKTCLSAQ